ncbi:manganese efflux pump MntP family protein [Paenibacillus hodogayensis]|uniref:Putative manganese efflux pump MntP n=1 Tax=Paenibacillus hodogayensis TaxID=279208 RepID=A0ABV5W7J2_9BACL
MVAVSAGTGQLITVIVMAIALGMDAFSLGIGIGLRGIRLLDILKISFVIGLFHVLMPLVGMYMGHYVGELLGNVATLLGGMLLIMLGAHMIFSSFKSGGDARSFDHRKLGGLLLFALTVSVDSMSVGVSLGMFATDLLFTVLMFGAAGGLMSVFGLLLGRRASSWIGEYGEALGGIILLAFGIRFLI